MARLLVLGLALAGLLPGAPKKALPVGRGETETVEITATLYPSKESIKEIIGSDLDGHYVVVAVELRSRFGREIDVRRDDFLLRTDKDGEKSTPFAASQIAGRGALVITESGRGGTPIMGDSGGPIWGGTPGTGERPRRMGGDGGALGAGGGSTETKGTFEQSGKDKKLPPLQKVLEERILPEQKTEKSLSGLLYFPLGKQKAKDLELIYTAADGKVSVRFR
ncbi:MAG TPA: hypothetical protein VN442_10155 [Bryobacteraceae bacterium]|nr:hypothetical protein [Bryobacteraceae bacterium]